MVKSIAISQPRFLPAINYLQRIYFSDEFIILDNVQHQRRAYEHRNKIACGNRIEWASLQIDRSLTTRPKISDMLLASENTLIDSFEKCRSFYSGAPYFNEEFLKELLLLPAHSLPKLSFVDISVLMLGKIFELLSLKTVTSKLFLSSNLSLPDISGPENLLRICQERNTTHYISGPNGRDYLLKTCWPPEIQILYHDFNYPEYNRGCYDPICWLSFLDPLFWAGPDFVISNITAPPLLNKH